MSEEMNVSGADTAVENSDMPAENSDIEGTAEEVQGTNAENENADNSKNAGNDENQNGENESENQSQEEEPGQESAPQDDEVFLAIDDGNTIMRSQAENFAKLGYEYQKNVASIMEKFERIAAASAKTDGGSYSSVEEFADLMLNAMDETLREQCLTDARGDEALGAELFNSRKAQRDKKYSELKEKREKELQQAQNQKSSRIAEEFLKLQKKFPEIKTYGDLPQEVKNYAAKNGVSLLEAKLTIDYDNRIAADKAKADAENAAEKTTGSQSGSADSGTDDVIAAMLRGASRN